MEILGKLAQFCCQPEHQALDGILYFHRITDLKFSGRDMVKLRLLQALCGPDFYPHLTIVSTMWDRIPNEDVEMQCQERVVQLRTSPRHWADIISKGAHHFPFRGDQASGLAIMQHVHQTGHGNQLPRFFQELGAGRPLEATDAASVVLLERRKREEKMRQEVEEERLELEAETRQVQTARRQRRIQDRPVPQGPGPTKPFSPPHRSNTYPYGERAPRSPEPGRRRRDVVVWEEEASSGRSGRDRHADDERRERHDRSGLSFGINIHISKNR